MCRRAALAGSCIDQRLCRGRGVVKFVKRMMGLAQDVGGTARTFKTNKLGKLKRQLVDLLKQGLRNTAAVAQQRLWDKCRRNWLHLLSTACCMDVWNAIGTPCTGDIQHLLACLRGALQNEATCARNQRERAWKDNFAADWAEGGSTSFAWCKGEANDKAEMIARLDGTLTCDSKEMDSLIRSAWLPIFCMYDTSPPPSWHDFEARFGQHFVGKHPMQLEPLDGKSLQHTLRRMKSKSAAGCDGWRVNEMKKLPIALLDRLSV